MKHHALLPNVATAFALSCGLFVIFKMNMLQPGQVTYQNVLAAVSILLVAAFLDVLDGMIARKMNAESSFGGQFDSLADAVSFGVAPSVVALKTLSVEAGTSIAFFVTLGAIIYSICGILRLVRYNVNRYEAQGNEEKMALEKASFTGLPIPAAAAIMISTTLFFSSDDAKLFSSLGSLDIHDRAVMTTCVSVVLGYFMVSRWKFPSLKTLNLRVSSFQVVLIIAFLAAVILVGALHHFPLLFAGISWCYLIVSWVLSCVRKILGKRVQSLDDFDPEE